MPSTSLELLGRKELVFVAVFGVLAVADFGAGVESGVSVGGAPSSFFFSP